MEEVPSPRCRVVVVFASPVGIRWVDTVFHRSVDGGWCGLVWDGLVLLVGQILFVQWVGSIVYRHFFSPVWEGHLRSYRKQSSGCVSVHPISASLSFSDLLQRLRNGVAVVQLHRFSMDGADHSSFATTRLERNNIVDG